MTRIGSKAFFGCYDLTTVTIPKSMTSVGDEAFSNCDALTTIKVSVGDVDHVRDILQYEVDIDTIEFEEV